MRDVLYTFLFSIGFNVAMFIPAFIYKTDKLTDISYAITFLAVAAFGYTRSDQEFPHIALTFMIFLWASRLGIFLYRRILRMKHDKRFDGMREKFFKFLGFWLIQAITVPVVMISAILFFDQKDVSISVLSYFGLAVFLSGLIIEAVADNQKFVFSGDPKNKDTWIDTGLWSISRHPNYLGEMMVWTGVYLFVVSSLPWTSRYVALLSPAYIIGLLLFVSGVPLREKSADKKWGDNPLYKKYKKSTPVLVPFIRSK